MTKNERNETAGRARGDLIALRAYLEGLRAILAQNARTLDDYGGAFPDPERLPGFTTQGGVGWEAWNVRADLNIARRAVERGAEVAGALAERLRREGGVE